MLCCLDIQHDSGKWAERQRLRPQRDVVRERPRNRYAQAQITSNVDAANGSAGRDHAQASRDSLAAQRDLTENRLYPIAAMAASSAREEATEPKMPPCALIIFSPMSWNSGK